MSVIAYGKGDHPGGFEGLRVAVRVGDEHRQQYYNFRRTAKTGPKATAGARTKRGYCTHSEAERMTTEAAALNIVWKLDQADHQQHQLQEAKPMDKRYQHPHHQTGVSGIRLVYRTSINEAGNKRYFTPCFLVQITKNRAQYYRSFPFESTLEDAWYRACKYAAKVKGVRHQPWIKKCPDITQVNLVRIRAESHYGLGIQRWYPTDLPMDVSQL